MAVATKQLAADPSVPTGLTSLYTTPSGKRTIVKSVVVYNGYAGTNYASLYVYRSGSPIAELRIYCATSGGSGDTQVILPWMVIEQGDSLQMTTQHGSVATIISGTELTL